MMNKHISEESIAYQKKVAVNMWQFVKRWYSKNPDEYRHPMWLKEEFCYKYFKKTGQLIDWESNCILCSKFHGGCCRGCPLYKEDSELFCYDYFKLSDEDFPFHMRPSVCDKIINAIKSFEG